MLRWSYNQEIEVSAKHNEVWIIVLLDLSILGWNFHIFLLINLCSDMLLQSCHGDLESLYASIISCCAALDFMNTGCCEYLWAAGKFGASLLFEWPLS